VPLLEASRSTHVSSRREKVRLGEEFSYMLSSYMSMWLMHAPYADKCTKC
jgi:hypothetical protein